MFIEQLSLVDLRKVRTETLKLGQIFEIELWLVGQ